MFNLEVADLYFQRRVLHIRKSKFGKTRTVPVIESNFITATGGPPTTSSITLLEQSELMVADDGQTMLDASQEASLQMDSAPATPPTPLISLWQQNMLGIKAEHFIYWLMRRAAAVQEITGFPAGGSGLPLSAGTTSNGSGPTAPAGAVGTGGTRARASA